MRKECPLAEVTCPLWDTQAPGPLPLYSQLWPPDKNNKLVFFCLFVFKNDKLTKPKTTPDCQKHLPSTGFGLV